MMPWDIAANISQLQLTSTSWSSIGCCDESHGTKLCSLVQIAVYYATIAAVLVFIGSLISKGFFRGTTTLHAGKAFFTYYK
jgi:hypothetical protein